MSTREYTKRVVVDYSNRKNPDLERPFGDIADRLNEWKNQSQVMHKELAEASEISIGTISKVYQGVRFPDYRLLRHLHEKHNVDLNWLICGDKA